MESKHYISASRGIGLEFARQLLLEPETIVFATCRNPDSATQLRELKEKDETKGTLHIVCLDVEKESTIKDAAAEVQSILGEEGALDYLINNAGLVSTTHRLRVRGSLKLTPDDRVSSMTRP